MQSGLMPAGRVHALEQLFLQTRAAVSLQQQMQTRRAFHQALRRTSAPQHPSLSSSSSSSSSSLSSSFRTRAGRRVSQPNNANLTTTRSIHSASLFTNPLRSQKRPSPSTTNSVFSQSFRRRGGGRRSNSSSGGGAGAGATGSDEKLSFSQRMKKLSREYGWSALGVYLLLTALDFPFCFLAVRLLGTDRIGHWEHVVVSYVKETLNWPVSAATTAKDDVEVAVAGIEKAVVNANADDAVEQGASKRILEEPSQAQHATATTTAGADADSDTVSDHGYKEAEKANSGVNASIWTQLALAYAIHKSFIFIRVPLTAAVTPKVVKTLRSWGWNIGKVPKSSSAGAGAGSNTSNSGLAAQSSKTGVNTRGSKVRPDD